MKFKGSLKDLKDRVLLTGLDGEWRERPNGHFQYRADTGAVLNWWEGAKTIMFQGPKDEAGEFESLFCAVEVPEAAAGIVARPAREQAPQNRVFVVYGHDEDARNQLDAMLRRWGLEPLILDQLPSKGQTIIEKLEEYTSDVGFAVVLATPDDEGHRRSHEDEKRFRARQNVILELGMLLTKLGREKVAILLTEQDKMERPSDIQGLIYIPFKENLQREAGALLAKEMVAQGYSIAVKNL